MNNAEQRRVFVAGGTGYMGIRLIRELLHRGHEVAALVRPGREKVLPSSCRVVKGNALDAKTFVDKICGADTWVHLVGVPHPSPSKAAEFRAVDLQSVRAAAAAAVQAGVAHFVYVSVAHPGPMMKAYIEVRSACEEILQKSGLNATFLRPWYVLGPGHRWPYVLQPIYWLFELFPASRESARRLGLVTLTQMVRALVWAVENPWRGIRILDVPKIRST